MELELFCNGDPNVLKDVLNNMRNGFPIIKLENASRIIGNKKMDTEIIENIDSESSSYEPSSSEPGSSDSECDSEIILINRKKSNRQTIVKTPAQYSRAPRTTKKHCCLFCGCLLTKLPRHLEVKHSGEPDVKKVLNLEKASLERKRAWLDLQKLGDFKHLQGQIKNDTDTNIIPLRRLQHKQKPSLQDYAVCPKCKGIFTKKKLKNHVREICDPEKRASRRTIVRKSRLMTLKVHPKTNELVRKYILAPMRDDLVVKIVSQDELAMTYANYSSLKFRSSLHHYKMIRHQLRHLGDIFLQVKKINGKVTNLTALYNPQYFDDVVKAIQIDSGFDIETGKYRTPTRATSACALIQRVGEIAVTRSISTERPDLQTLQENFLKLLKTLKNSLINRTALENLTQCRRQKKVSLPKTDDVNIFFNYINERIHKTYIELYKKFNKAIWTTLSKLVLIHLMLFNRRRPGEIERAFISDYSNLEKVDEEFLSTLSQEELQYGNNFCRFIIRGKLNKPVPVILHSTLKKSLDLIIHHRNKLGIPFENQYLFAKPSDSLQTYFQAHLALKQFLSEGNFPINCRITATNLRKHLASVVAGLHIDETKLTDVVDFMGHHVDVHKRIYRQMPVARDVINMGQILMTASGTRTDDLELISETEHNSEANDYRTDRAGSISPDQNFLVEDPHDLEDNTSMLENVGNTGKLSRRIWTEEENAACMKYFSEFFNSGLYPSAGHIRYVCAEVSCLRSQTPRKLKAHLQHLKSVSKSKGSKAKRNLSL